MSEKRVQARVLVDGQRYSIGCAVGDEAKIEKFARELDSTMAALRNRLGDIGDERLAVMAGLTVLDRLAAAEAANQKLQGRIDALERAREAAVLAADADDDLVVTRIEAMAAAVDRLAGTLKRDTRRMKAAADSFVPVADAASPGEPSVGDCQTANEPAATPASKRASLAAAIPAAAAPLMPHRSRA